MTEYEILDLVASMEAHMAIQFSLYLTVVSAYMVVAYFVGASLTRPQVIIASAMMIFAAGGQTWALYTTLGRVTEYLNLKLEISALTDYEQNFAVNTYAWVAICTAGIFAALYFMWGVRRAQTD